MLTDKEVNRYIEMGMSARELIRFVYNEGKIDGVTACQKIIGGKDVEDRPLKQ